MTHQERYAPLSRQRNDDDVTAEAQNRDGLNIQSSEIVVNSATLTLADLPVHNFQVDGETLTETVVSTLKAYRNLPGVVVVNGQQVSLISRKLFFEQLGQTYGVALYI